ncbi:MAG: hypothetical protein ACRDKI_09000 [Solirubrobacterales bacterium]
MAAKSKLTAYVDPVVHRTLKITAARQGLTESQIVDAALKAQLGLASTEQAQQLTTLTADQAMQAAVDEVRAYRRLNPITK